MSFFAAVVLAELKYYIKQQLEENNTNNKR